MFSFSCSAFRILSFVAIFSCTAAISFVEQSYAENKLEEEFVLIDTDAGIDDAWAIFLMLQAHQNQDIPLNIVGITTTHGNTGVDNVTLNVARILDAALQNDIPVYRGSESAMVLPIEYEYSIWVGEDGFGDAHLPIISPILEPEHAVSAIIRLAEEYKGKLTILSIAPLTNLAMAIRLKPDLKNMIKSVYILGGNHQGVGNVRVASEFNFYADVEAAHVVLENYEPASLHIVPLETASDAISNCTFRKEVLGRIKSRKIDLLNAIEANIFTLCETEGWLAWDALAASVLLDPSVGIKSEKHQVSVELHGELTRGMMVVEKRSPPPTPSSGVTIYTAINHTLYEEMLMWAALENESHE